MYFPKVKCPIILGLKQNRSHCLVLEDSCQRDAVFFPVVCSAVGGGGSVNRKMAVSAVEEYSRLLRLYVNEMILSDAMLNLTGVTLTMIQIMKMNLMGTIFGFLRKTQATQTPCSFTHIRW